MMANLHFLDDKNKFIMLFFILFLAPLALYLLLFFLNHVLSFIPFRSYDEKYYINSGKEYVLGRPPAEVNWEHPPLAKYFIGLCYLYEIKRLCSLMSIILAGIIYAVILKEFKNNFIFIITFSLFFIFEPIVFSLGFHSLLDTFVLPFVLLSLLLYLRVINNNCNNFHYLVLLSVVIAASLSSKLSSIYPLMGIAIHYFY
ncbi:MAG: hypothetical protein ABWW69_00705, partial [Pyrodictiaceae archaeon]